MKVDTKEIKLFLEMFEDFRGSSTLLAQEIRNNIHREIYFNWVKAAKQQLHSTKNMYINSLLADDDGVTLYGEFANALENGCDPYDLKPSFAASSKAKRKKDGGWYLVIPFRILTPNAVGGGTTFNKQQYSYVKRGLQIPVSLLPPKKSRDVIDIPKKKIYFPGYENKASILEGINISTGSNGKNQYNTFRVVSDKSSPGSWIHSGLRQYNLADIALQNTNIDKIVEDTIGYLIP